MHSVLVASNDGNFLAFAHGSWLKVFDTRSNTFVKIQNVEALPLPDAHPNKKSQPKKITEEKHDGNSAEPTKKQKTTSSPKPSKADSSSSSSKKETPSDHLASAVIRAMVFDPETKVLFTAGDDKCVRCFDVSNWECTQSRLMDKKVTSLATSASENVLLVADKFGSVISLHMAAIKDKSYRSFGHYSFITDIAMSENGDFVISADRDEKIRVSSWPQTFIIQSFCFGHTSFVSKLCVLPDVGLLVSGGADGYVRLWDYKKGKLLSSVDIGACVSGQDQDVEMAPSKSESQTTNEEAKAGISDNSPIVNSIAYCQKHQIILAGTHSHPSLVTLVVEDGTLLVKGSLSLQSSPSDMLIDSSDRLWVTSEEPQVMMFLYDEETKTFVEQETTIVTEIREELKKDVNPDVITTFENLRRAEISHKKKNMSRKAKRQKTD